MTEMELKRVLLLVNQIREDAELAGRWMDGSICDETDLRVWGAMDAMELADARLRCLRGMLEKHDSERELGAAVVPERWICVSCGLRWRARKSLPGGRCPECGSSNCVEESAAARPGARKEGIGDV